MIFVQGTNLEARHWNSHLDAVVKIILHKRITIDHVIYVKHYHGTISYITVFMDDVLNTTNSCETFVELKHV